LRWNKASAKYVGVNDLDGESASGSNNRAEKARRENCSQEVKCFSQKAPAPVGLDL